MQHTATPLSGLDSRPNDAALFRSEALAEQHTATEGRIVLTPRLPMTFVALAAVAVAACVIAALMLGSYTRRATVTGQLVPAAGVLRVFTPQAGVVLEKRVVEGQPVKKGDIMFVLGSERFGVGARDLQADIGLQIGERKRLLELELTRNARTEREDLAHLQRRAATLRSEGETIARQIDQQRQRVALAEEARKRYKGLAERDYIAGEQLTQKELELSEQQSRLTALQRDQIANQRELASTQREADALKGRSDSQNAVIQRSISSSSQELTELEARRRVVITAPESGTATLISAELGQLADLARPMVTLLPAASPLEARLYAPSRTVGFVKVSDKVALRHQAFPYQKYGQQTGVVTAVSTNAVPSTELVGFVLPDTSVGEPVYAITVELSGQTINANGQPRPLQAGMRVDADIFQETRKLYEWLLEPLFSITGRVQQ